MPTFPKYSERISFLFAIFEKEIPMTRESRFLSSIRSLFGFSGDNYMNLNRSNSIIGRKHRIPNNNRLPTPDGKYICQIRIALKKFFFDAMALKNLRKASFIRQLRMMIHNTMKSVNSALECMNYTWLQKYGTVLSSELQFKDTEDFFEFIVVAYKIIDPSLKPLTKELERYDKPIGDIQSFYAQKRAKARPLA